MARNIGKIFGENKKVYFLCSALKLFIHLKHYYYGRN